MRFPLKTLFLLVPLVLLLVAGGPVGCGAGETTETALGDLATSDVENLRLKAIDLAQRTLIVDTHIDVPYRMTDGMEDVSQRTDGGDFDFVRAQEGGLDAPFMSIYVPASYQETGGAKTFADELIDMVETIVAGAPDKFALARNPADLEANRAAGRISLPMGMENGAPVEDDLRNVAYFFDRGIRYITLTHSKNNQICDSSYEPPDQRTWGGLSPFGRDVVREMNRLGMMVDVSHISDDAFHQVMDLTAAPVIASHSSARGFTPGFERNMDDDMIRALANNGGVIQINFGSTFLTSEANAYSRTRRRTVGDQMRKQGIEVGSDEARALSERYKEANPYPFATIDDVVEHIDHVVQLVGVDHVGLGSDFDGVGDSLPEGLKDVSYYPNLIHKLLEKGYSEADVEKILSGNLMRVWREVERVASELQARDSEAA
ncbi:MAG: dipeptidase [Acidobacteriota bacterium]